MSRVINRAPIRLAPPPSQGGQGSQDGAQKIDPRQVRFTEKVASILNDILGKGMIFKDSDNTWSMKYLPRQITDVESSVGELFYSTDSSKLSYRDPSNVIHVLY